MYSDKNAAPCGTAFVVGYVAINSDQPSSAKYLIVLTIWLV